MQELKLGSTTRSTVNEDQQLALETQLANTETASEAATPLSTGDLLTLSVAFLAALGIGSVVAAGIARWNSISALRQAWVNSLRDEISEFFYKVDRFGAMLAKESHSPAELEELRVRRDEAMASYRQILLRLNFREVQHRKLDYALTSIMDLSDRIDEKK